MATFHLYSATEGGHIAGTKVTVRKFPADLAKTREHRFRAVSADGATVLKTERYILTAANLAAWREATDALRALPTDASAKDVKTARAAVAATLAGIVPLTGESAISPTRAQMAALRAVTDAATFAADLAAGALIVPSMRADEGASTKAARAKMTESERTAALVADLFAEVEPEASEPTDADASEPDAEPDADADAVDASEPDPEA